MPKYVHTYLSKHIAYYDLSAMLSLISLCSTYGHSSLLVKTLPLCSKALAFTDVIYIMGWTRRCLNIYLGTRPATVATGHLAMGKESTNVSGIIQPG